MKSAHPGTADKRFLCRRYARAVASCAASGSGPSGILSKVICIQVCLLVRGGLRREILVKNDILNSESACLAKKKIFCVKMTKNR